MSDHVRLDVNSPCTPALSHVARQAYDSESYVHRMSIQIVKLLACSMARGNADQHYWSLLELQLLMGSAEY